MKKIYLLFILLTFGYSSLYAQSFDCPSGLGNQSTVSILHFKIPSGTCGQFPSTILVSNPGGSENYVYNLLSCNGTNLKYQTISASVIANAANFDVDFGLPDPCNYRNGQLTSLSNSNVTLNEAISIFPNPVSGNTLNIKVADYITARVSLYSVTGKQVLKSDIINTSTKHLNVSGLSKGVYMLKIETNEASVTRKVIIM